MFQAVVVRANFKKRQEQREDREKERKKERKRERDREKVELVVTKIRYGF